jgi:hypothetical protein
MTVLNNYASKSGKRLTTSEEMNGYAHAPSWLVEVMCAYISDSGKQPRTENKSIDIISLRSRWPDLWQGQAQQEKESAGYRCEGNPRHAAY